MHGKRRYERRSGWKNLDNMIRSAIDRAGLTNDVIRLGLRRPIPSGSSLSASTRRGIALVRALLSEIGVGFTHHSRDSTRLLGHMALAVRADGLQHPRA